MSLKNNLGTGTNTGKESTGTAKEKSTGKGGSPRRSGPTDKMQEFAHKIAYGLNIDMPNLSDFDAVRKFIDENVDKFKNRAPTPAQMEFANKIASEIGESIPREVSSTSVALSAWIDANKGRLAPFQPTRKQVDFAMKIADKKGIEIPPDILEDARKLSEWIDANAGDMKKK